MEYLANVYSTLAYSDQVWSRVTSGKRELPAGDDYTVRALTDAEGRSLPLIEVAGVSVSKARATTMTRRVTSALQEYVSERQRESRIPEDTRVDLPVIATTRQAEVVTGVKLTTPVMIALLGLVATLFVAFTVDNLRRQRQLAETLDDDEQTDARESRVRSLSASSEMGAPRAEAAERRRSRESAG